MKIKHILTLMLLLTVSVAFGQAWNYQLNYRNMKYGNTTDGILQFNGLATFVNGINVPLRSLSDSSDNAASTKFVKQLVQGLGSPLTFGNGLTKTSNSVGLGGQLNNTTILDLNGNPLLIAGNGIFSLSATSLQLVSNVDNTNFGFVFNSEDFKNKATYFDGSSTGKGLFYEDNYSKNLTINDTLAIPTVGWINKAISSAVSGNYIATNNGTGNNTSLNTPTITNGSANNMTVGLTSPTTGRFTALTATTTATVPTVATSDNSTNAASTAHVKANLANYASLTTDNLFNSNSSWSQRYRRISDGTMFSDIGWDSFRVYRGSSYTTYGHNLINTAPSAGNAFNIALPSGFTGGSFTTQFRPLNGTVALTSDFATGQTIGANTTGSSASALTWGGSQADFGSAGSNLSTIVGRNTSGVAKPYSFADVKAALGTSLQDVTNVNPGTTNTIVIKKNSGGVGIDITNETDATFKMGVTAAGASNMYGWVGSDVQGQALILNPDNNANVGVGKMPVSKLDINGSARASSNDGNDNTLVRNIDLQAATLQTVPVSSTSQSMTANRVYIPHSASLTTFTLPTTATEGQLFQIVGEGSGGWRISQNASQQIVGVNVATTSGTSGSVQSTNANCTITIRCTVANSKFTITSSQGTLTIN